MASEALYGALLTFIYIIGTSSAFTCRNNAVGTPQTTVQAGNNFAMRWTMPAAHPGDCAVVSKAFEC